VLLWGLLLAALAVLLRRGWLKLFGPVLFYDLVRLARRGRYPLLRCLYALFLLLMLCSVYQAHGDLVWGGVVDSRAMAEMGAAFFATFMVVQFLAVVFLTPAYTAGAIAEEKERRTLEFLLATDLQNREIVLSKQLSRLANLALLVLAGLPILSFTQFLGGVDPDLVLAGFAATGLTMVGLASLSILCSVYSRRARNAIVVTYLTMVAYSAISGALLATLALNPQVAAWSLTGPSNPFTVQDLADALNAGNPFVVVVKLETTLGRQQSYADVLPGLLREYALFYGSVSVMCTVWAVLRLRAVALKEVQVRVKKRWWGARRRARPYLGNRPMVWKEVSTEPGFQMNWFGRIAIALLIGVSFIPPVWIGIYYFDNTPAGRGTSGWQERGESLNAWVRSVGTIVACLTLLGVAVRASGSISGERDRQTWDSLLTSPLDSTEILFGKWLGSIAGVRWGWAWLGLIWGLGAVTGGLSILAVPLLVGAWAIYGGFVAILGLWFSIVSRTTVRANVWTLLATIGVAVGHWLPWMTCCIPFMLGGTGEWMAHVAEFQAFGLTPPVTLGWLAFRGGEFGYPGGWSYARAFTLMAVVGLGLWAVGTAILWGLTSKRLREVTRRRASFKPLAPLAPRLEVLPLGAERGSPAE
jgi:ABC-type transport system involved in multi-copper enzyme maturation permease subunit